MSENCFFCDNWSHSGFCIIKNKYTKFFEKCDDFVFDDIALAKKEEKVWG